MHKNKLAYKKCLLHNSQPLNLICLHNKCINNRILCAMCKQQYHNNHHIAQNENRSMHIVIPIKMYLGYKIQQIKSMTVVDGGVQYKDGGSKGKGKEVSEQIGKSKNLVKEKIAEFRKQILGCLNSVQRQLLAYIYQKINIIKQITNKNSNNQYSYQASDIQKLEKILQIASNQQHYHNHISQLLQQSKTTIFNQLDTLKNKINTKAYISAHQWKCSKQFSISDNILQSKQDSYKIAYFQKPISKVNNRCIFHIVRSIKNWVAAGIAHKQIVQNNEYFFKYYTIGHGVFLLALMVEYSHILIRLILRFSNQNGQQIYMSVDENIDKDYCHSENQLNNRQARTSKNKQIYLDFVQLCIMNMMKYRLSMILDQLSEFIILLIIQLNKILNLQNIIEH